MAENLERLKAIRGAHRGVTTKLTQQADGIFEKESLTSDDYERLFVINQQLETKLSTLNEYDQKILTVCEVANIENEIEESQRAVEKIMESKRKIDLKLKRRSNESSGQNHDSNASTSQEPKAKARLPKLSLPKFRGDVTKWSTFWDSFQSAIHDNREISKVDKFNYLNSVLEGAAARAIAGLTLTASNYDNAVEILQDRFGKPQQIISAHMDELIKLQPSHNDRPASLRYVYDQISVHVRGLASLGISTEQYGSLLIPVVMSKLPNEIRLQVARNTTDEIWKIEELLQTIKKEVEARETSEHVKTSESPRKSPFVKPPIPTANSLVANKVGDIPVKCVYCKEIHFSASCGKVEDPNRRKEILVKERRCLNCLKPGHVASVCKNPKTCRHCGERHHQSICTTLSKHRSEEKSTTKPSEGEFSNTTTTNTVRDKGTVLLQTARATAINEENSKSTEVRILFDNGSQRSYVTSSLMSRLNLKPVKTETLHLNTFGGSTFRKQSCDVIKLRLKGQDGEEVEISALSYPTICSPLPSKVKVNYPHLEGLQLADELDDNCGSIDVLIGSDYYWEIVGGETVRGDHGPTAISSKFGWLLSGPLRDSVTSDTVSSNLVISGDCPFAPHENDELISNLERFWKTESIGIQEAKEDVFQRKEEFVSVKHNGERYEIELPWKNDCLPIPDNYNLCYNRLKSMHHKLSKTPEVLREYDGIIQEQLASGIIEKVPNPEVETRNNEDTHYLPHHAVIRQNRETTKLRIVYDGSAKSPGQEHSLNDCLPTGPNYIPQLVDVLARFRWNPIAISADIEKAFLMISIQESHQDMLCFLWLKDPFVFNSEVLHLRFCRLVFGLRPSPSILGATLTHHLDSYKECYPEVVELIKNSLYVDDLLAGAGNVQEGFEMCQQSKELMAKGGFNLRKWNSNSASLLQLIDNKEKAMVQPKTEESNPPIEEEDESFTKSTIGPNQVSDKLVKTLGVCWDTESDEMSFDFKELIEYANTLQVTKRSLLKLSAKVFDPLGFLSPFTITMKCEFQSLCLEKFDWDVELQGNRQKLWKNFVSSLTQLNNVRVPRCYFNSSMSPTNIQIHAFSDASKKAYAAAVYLRSEYEDGHVEVKLLSSKTRVAPIKQQTIPRLELLGATISARLVSNLLKSLPCEIKPTFWVDSTTVLYWIKQEKPWKQYVQNRVQEIRQSVPEAAWNYCPGTQNPADLPSRGLSGKELVESSLWWNGPEFFEESRQQLAEVARSESR